MSKATSKTTLKKVAFIGAISMVSMLALNTLAKRFGPAAKVKNTIETGL